MDRIAELLEVTYRSADLGNLDDVLSETVYIMLSLNTKEYMYQKVFASLREDLPDLESSSAERTDPNLRGC